MTISELKEKGIEFWADNDGGYWYWDEYHNQRTVKE